MSNVSKDMNELLTALGQAAPDITHKLKCVGNGDMQGGVVRIAKLCQKQGYSSGLKAGKLKGFAGGAAVVVGLGLAAKGISSLIAKQKKNRVEADATKNEKDAIVSILKEDTEKSDKEVHEVTDSDIGLTEEV